MDAALGRLPRVELCNANSQGRSVAKKSRGGEGMRNDRRGCLVSGGSNLCVADPSHVEGVWSCTRIAAAHGSAARHGGNTTGAANLESVFKTGERGREGEKNMVRPREKGTTVRRGSLNFRSCQVDDGIDAATWVVDRAATWQASSRKSCRLQDRFECQMPRMDVRLTDVRCGACSEVR